MEQLYLAACVVQSQWAETPVVCQLLSQRPLLTKKIDPSNSRGSVCVLPFGEDFRHVLKASFKIMEKCLQP